jgi:nucleotide-binding universal stress UspA family protein
MTAIPYPITKILLPYDGSPSAQNALTLAAHLAMAGREAVTGVTLLQVIGGSYLARHVHNVDLRVIRMDKDQDWQRIRQRYLEEDIRPLLAAAQKTLEDLGVQAPIEVRILEGKVSDEIMRLAREEQFSTVIMGRRGLSPLKALFLGSVTRGVLTQAQGLTVYIAPPEAVPETACPISPLLLPIDGSKYSLAAVRLAAALAQAFREMKPSLTLLHVVDIDLLGRRIEEGVDVLVQEGEAYLAKARALLQEAGLEGCWREKLISGQPAPAILQEAKDGAYPLILMGSRGHSALAHLLVGSVTSSVVHTVTGAAVGVVYG